MEKLFGTDGVRGVANTELSPEKAMKIGCAGAYALAGQLGRPPKILIGTDTRISADMLEAALIAGLCSVGAHVSVAGVIPSPAMAFLVRHYKMDAGVMLSASHNPMPDNGIKFFNSKGCKLSDEVEEEIEALIWERYDSIPRPTGAGVGRVSHTENKATEDYISFLESTFAEKQPLKGLRVALDCANGATGTAAPIIFEKLGAKIFPMHYKPNGININDGCGSTHLESIREYVKANNVDIGLAFDGDGDRVLGVDDKGEEFDGDVIMAVCGLAMLKNGKLNNKTIVSTVMSNLGLEQFCEREGIKLLRTDVGDRYVMEEMVAGGHNLGGEQSGHIILYDYNSTGDGILTGLHLLANIKAAGLKMSDLRKAMVTLPQVLLKAEIGKNKDYQNNPVINAAIDKITKDLAGSGRLLVRPSGTEPIIRVMMEGKDLAEIEKTAKDLTALIEKEMQ